MEAGLRIACREGYQQLIVEGDSQLIIRMLKKMKNGTPLNRITTSWRLGPTLEGVFHLLSQVNVHHPLSREAVNQ
jgi:hypothetical protein